MPLNIFQTPLHSLLERFVDFSFRDSLVTCRHAQDGIECPDPQEFVIWHRQPLVPGNFCIKDDVTSGLVNNSITSVFAEGFHKLLTEHRCPSHFRLRRNLSAKGSASIFHRPPAG